MEILYLLIPIALIFLVIAIRFLYWAINSGQYDDLDTEAQRILFDDEPLQQTGDEKTPTDKSFSSSCCAKKSFRKS